MIFIVILHVLVSLVLILVILLQAGKGGGLSESFGGASQQLFGTKSSAFLNRATAVCAFLFLITCLSLGVLVKHGTRSLLETVPPEASQTNVTEVEVPTVEGLDESLPEGEGAETLEGLDDVEGFSDVEELDEQLPEQKEDAETFPSL